MDLMKKLHEQPKATLDAMRKPVKWNVYSRFAETFNHIIAIDVVKEIVPWSMRDKIRDNMTECRKLDPCRQKKQKVEHAEAASYHSTAPPPSEQDTEMDEDDEEEDDDMDEEEEEQPVLMDSVFPNHPPVERDAKTIVKDLVKGMPLEQLKVIYEIVGDEIAEVKANKIAEVKSKDMVVKLLTEYVNN
jgi:hypothetical protein